MLGAPTQPHTHRALPRLQGSGMCCSQPAQQFSIMALVPLRTVCLFQHGIRVLSPVPNRVCLQPVEKFLTGLPPSAWEVMPHRIYRAHSVLCIPR